MKPRKLFWTLVLIIPLAILAMSTVVMYLWNWLLPAIFTGVASISLWQAAGLLVLSRILFGGFRGHGRWHGRRACRGGHGGFARWRVAALNDEERAAWRERMQQRCSSRH